MWVSAEVLQTDEKTLEGKDLGGKEKMNEKGGSQCKAMVTMPYVSDVLQRALRRQGVDAFMKPHKTLKQLLVHTKDKRSPYDTVGGVCLILANSVLWYM